MARAHSARMSGSSTYVGPRRRKRTITTSARRRQDNCHETAAERPERQARHAKDRINDAARLRRCARSNERGTIRAALSLSPDTGTPPRLRATAGFHAEEKSGGEPAAVGEAKSAACRQSTSRGYVSIVPPSPNRPEEGWLRFAVKQLFLGGLGFPGSDLLPEGGWLRRAAIAVYVLLALLIARLVVLLVTQR